VNNKVAFKAQIGSANYNLLLPSSDEDFVTFYYPTYDDLYNRSELSRKSTVTDTEDNSWSDVRKLRDGLIKSNPNTLEVLFSVNVEHNDDPLWEELHAIREDIASMNRSHLFDASFGMFHNEMKRYEREVKKGDTVRAGKAAASGFRIMLTVYDYWKKDFTDYAGCLWYDEYLDKGGRDHLLKMKCGAGKPEFIKEQVQLWYTQADNLRPKFHAYFKNEETEKDVRDIVHYYTKKQVKNELLFGGN
jgi:hypothetical protein